MVSSLLKLGFRSIDMLATTAAERRLGRNRVMDTRHHPLAAYPRLHVILKEAERTGLLAAERRRLMARRPTA